MMSFGFYYATTLNQFEMSKIWELVPMPSGIFIIETIFRNKINENENIIRNKARLCSSRLMSRRSYRL